MKNDSYFTQFDEIKKDLKKVQKEIVKHYSIQAEKDLIKAFDSLIDSFYSQYKPNSYNRKHNLYYALENHKCKYSNGVTGIASIDVNPNDMNSVYRTNKENVFDLIWNKGIRGLPPRGDHPVENSFSWRNPNTSSGWQYYSEGSDRWVNPYWSGYNEPYKNLFNVFADIRGYSIKGKPRFAMQNFVDNWDATFNSSINKDIKNKIIKNIDWYK